MNEIINTMKNPRFIAAFAVAVAVMAGIQIMLGNGSEAGSSPPEIALVPPAGHCMLDPARPTDRRLLAMYEQSNEGLNHVLGGTVDCEQLARWRVEPGYYLDNLGLFLATLGRPRGPAGESRAVFIRIIAEELGTIGDMAALADEVERRVESSNDGIDLQNTTGLGVLDTDDIAVYFGIVQHLIADDGVTPRTIAGVLGSTLIDGEAITFGLYAPYEDLETIAALLAEQRENMRRLVDANGG